MVNYFHVCALYLSENGGNFPDFILFWFLYIENNDNLFYSLHECSLSFLNFRQTVASTYLTASTIRKISDIKAGKH